MAYSTWNNLPSGENVFTPRSYSERVWNILYFILISQVQEVMMVIMMSLKNLLLSACACCYSLSLLSPRKAKALLKMKKMRSAFFGKFASEKKEEISACLQYISLVCLSFNIIINKNGSTSSRRRFRHVPNLDVLRRVVRGPETLATKHRRWVRHRFRRQRVRV